MSTEALITSEARRLTSEQKELIKTVLFKGATDLELEFYWNTSERLNLDPFKRQIHAMKRWNSATEREEMQFMVSIEGLRSIASRCRTHDGKDAYAGSTKPKFTFKDKEQQHLDSAEVTVFRIVQGEPREFTAEVFYDECVQTKKKWEGPQGNRRHVGEEPNSMWKKRPRGQLGKCAEAAALRKAFPEETGGVYIEDELPERGEETERPEKPQKTTPRPEAEGMEQRKDEKPKTVDAHAEVVRPEQREIPEARHWSDLRIEKAYQLVRFPEDSEWPNLQVWQIEKAGDFMKAFENVPRADEGQQESVYRLALDCKFFAKIESRLVKKGYDLDEATAALRKTEFLKEDGELLQVPGDRLQDLLTAVNDLPELSSQ